MPELIYDDVFERLQRENSVQNCQHEGIQER